MPSMPQGGTYNNAGGRQHPNTQGGNYGGGGQNTVIIDRRNDGMGNFASGMMMGAALSGWGCGYGWGLGPTLGIGFGGWGFGMGFGGPRFGGMGYNNQVSNSYGVCKKILEQK